MIITKATYALFVQAINKVMDYYSQNPDKKGVASGNDSFIFEIVEECSLDLLLEREQYYLDLNPEYNIGMKSSGGDNLSKNPNREEIINKMTRSVRERYDKMSQEERNELHSYPMEKNSN